MSENGSASTFDPGTRDDRAALFDFLVEKTRQRDAYVGLQEHPAYRAHPTGLDIIEEMGRHREELLDADTGEKLWFALLKISNARRDRHMRVTPVEGGLQLSERQQRQLEAPIRFTVDYGHPHDRFFFIRDVAVGIESMTGGTSVPEPGDRLVAINGRTAPQHVEAMRPYHRYSNEDHFLWWLAGELTQTINRVPHDEFYGDELRLELERRDGERYEVTLPYFKPDEINWAGHGERVYPGFSLVSELTGFETFDLFLPDEPGLPVALLQWHRFPADLMQAMDALMDYAERHDLLDHAVIVDATRSGGGARGAYAVQRLQPRPFRTTFGNLKVSDLMQRWVDEHMQRVRDGGDSEAVDGGGWQFDWLETDVRRAIDEGLLYTNDVPFKLAHLPRWSDGIVHPAPVHFRGPLTVWMSPHGGSHLDQFGSQIVDNDLGHMIGMPCGGFSNSWEYEDVLRFPTTGRPIVKYMWSLGYTIRPNKQLLQYNPARPHEWFPQTRENCFDFHARLLARTLRRLDLPFPTALREWEAGQTGEMRVTRS